ncbi:hypothetical protein FRC04_005981 [Tulasnella sp. 424]|nr:hypothetical protein FRC04_005981 [Tulasnella sp. 424]
MTGGTTESPPVQLDVKSAFTTVSRPRLIHNMRLRHIPEHLTRVINSFLSDRKTSIKCGDFTNDQHLCDVGIPQSSPLLGLLYLFYNAPLVDLDGDPTFTVNLDSQGHADDINIAAMGKTVEEARTKLESTTLITERWSRQSASSLDWPKPNT